MRSSETYVFQIDNKEGKVDAKRLFGLARTDDESLGNVCGRELEDG